MDASEAAVDDLWTSLGLYQIDDLGGPNLPHPRPVIAHAQVCDGSIAARFAHAQPPRARDQSLSAAARRQSGRLVPMGRRSAAARARAEQTHPAFGRLLGVSLVPRDGARVLRGSGNRRADEPIVREHQGGSRGAARSRSNLPERASHAHPAQRRLAAHDVPRARPEALLRRNVLPEGGALQPAWLRRFASAYCAGLSGAARRHRCAERRAGVGTRAHVARGLGFRAVGCVGGDAAHWRS